MSSGIRPTIGTLSGAEQISQSCRQSIIKFLTPQTLRRDVACYVSSRDEHICLYQQRRCKQRLYESLSGGFWPSPWLIGFFCQHERGWAGDAAVFSYAPEVDDHQYTRNDRDANAVPNVRAQQRVGVHDRYTQHS